MDQSLIHSGQCPLVLVDFAEGLVQDPEGGIEHAEFHFPRESIHSDQPLELPERAFLIYRYPILDLGYYSLSLLH